MRFAAAFTCSSRKCWTLPRSPTRPCKRRRAIAQRRCKSSPRMQLEYGAAAEAWVGELATQFAADTKAQRHTLRVWAIAQVLASYSNYRRHPGAGHPATAARALRGRPNRRGAAGTARSNAENGVAASRHGVPVSTSARRHLAFSLSSEGIRQIYGVSPESVARERRRGASPCCIPRSAAGARGIENAAAAN